MRVEIKHCETAVQAKDLIYAMNGSVIEADRVRALEMMTGVGSDVWVGFVDDRPVCAWGLVPPTLISDRAYLWLHVTDAVEENKFLFVRRSQMVMQDLRKLYPTIYGVCEIGNKRAIRWMRWLGAEFGIPSATVVPFVINGAA